MKGIKEGDLVVAERNENPKEGDIVIAEIDGGWTMKYFMKKTARFIFSPQTKNINLFIRNMISKSRPW